MSDTKASIKNKRTNKPGTINQTSKKERKKKEIEQAKHKLIQEELAKLRLDIKIMRKRMKLDEISENSALSDLPKLLPTIGPGWNLNKRLLAEIYRKELSHYIFLIWSKDLYGDVEALNLHPIHNALRPLIKGPQLSLPPQNIFISNTHTARESDPLSGLPRKSNHELAGWCFVLLPRANVRGDNEIVWHKLAIQKAPIIQVSKEMLRQHMVDKHISIITAGHEDLVKTIPLKFVQSLYNNVERVISPRPASPSPTATKSKQTVEKPKEQAHSQEIKQKPVKKEGVKLDTQELQEPPFPVKSDSNSKKGKSIPRLDLDSDSDCQIIDRPVPRARSPEQPQQPKKEFIPVTSDTLDKALQLMSQFEKQRRAVAIVFDSCFFLEDINMKLVRHKFKDIFGHIEINQVLVRINMPNIAASLEDAKRLSIKTMNQAYIIAGQGMTENDINRKAAARGIFCCPMTLGCVVNNLKRGVFSMHRDVLENSSLISTQSINPKIGSNESYNISELNMSTNSNDSTASKGSSGSGKRSGSRIAASLGKEATVRAPESDEIDKVQTREATADSVSAFLGAHRVDKSFLDNLIMQGNSVLKIDNLPAKKSLLPLNLMMGTFTLKTDQVIASLRQSTSQSGKDLMDVRIVINKENDDVKRILSKNGLKTCYDTILSIDFSNQKELKDFISSRSSTLRRLDSSMDLPVNKIGYSTEVCKE